MTGKDDDFLSQQKITSGLKARLVIICLLGFFFFSLLFLQFFRIQIIEHDKWEKKAHQQHEWVISIPFKRGGFYSNTGIRENHLDQEKALVIDVPKFHLFCDAKMIPQESKQLVADGLWDILRLDTEKSHFVQQFFLPSRSRRLAMWLDRGKKQEIELWWRKLAKEKKIVKNALFFTQDYQRSYPFRSLLGPVLHTIRDFKEEKTRQGIPTGGLELQFNEKLKGKEGKRWFLRTLRHPLSVGGVIEKAQDGQDVILTINHMLQAIAEEEIERGIKKANAKSGFALIMNPRNGHILALAQYPFFYPQDYQDYFNDEDKIEYTKVKAVMDGYEPGSTLKPIILAACLKANQDLAVLHETPLFDPDAKIPTSSGNFPGRTRPLKDGRVHKYLNMDLALQKSSNIYPATVVDRLINRLGEQYFRSQLQDVFAFGKESGVELPLENIGLLPTPGLTYSNGKLQWSKSTPYSMAIGHNLQVNGLQLARAFSVLCNGGKLVYPTLVKGFRENDGEHVVFTPLIKDEPKQVLDPKITQRVLEGMKYVTKLGGTSRQAELRGFTEAGKSGTSYKIINGRYSQEKYFSSFIGFSPVSEEGLVIVVGVDEPEKKFIPGVGHNQQGGICAAPIFREIAKKAIEYLGLPPDDPNGIPNNDPRYNSKEADWVKKVSKLRALYEEWNQ